MIHKKLNPKLWKGAKLLPEIRTKLLVIVAKFNAYMGVDAEYADAVIVGSMANYNYSSYSDIDVHILYDFDALGWGDLKGEMEELLSAKKSLWNDGHAIKFYGHDIEVYAQNAAQETHSAGCYSLLKDKWLSTPSAVSSATADAIAANEGLARAKSDDIKSYIDASIAKGLTLARAEAIKDKIKKMRKSGLSDGGEFSAENLAFKALRNGGYIEKLYVAARGVESAEMSLESIKEGIISEATSAYTTPVSDIPDNMVGAEIRHKGVKYVLSRNTREGEKPFRLTYLPDHNFEDQEIPKIQHAQGDSFFELIGLLPEEVKRNAQMKVYVK